MRASSAFPIRRIRQIRGKEHRDAIGRRFTALVEETVQARLTHR